MNRLALLVLSTGVALASSGCIITTTTPSNGTFELDWTIASGTDFSSCTATKSANISFTISQGGKSIGTYTSTCSNFATTVDLAPGTYSYGAAMVDASGTARTTTASNTFTIYSNQRTIVPVDFPLSSFY